jgi:hypothetical protein
MNQYLIRVEQLPSILKRLINLKEVKVFTSGTLTEEQARNLFDILRCIEEQGGGTQKRGFLYISMIIMHIIDLKRLIRSSMPPIIADIPSETICIDLNDIISTWNKKPGLIGIILNYLNENKICEDINYDQIPPIKVYFKRGRPLRIREKILLDTIEYRNTHEHAEINEINTVIAQRHELSDASVIRKFLREYHRYMPDSIKQFTGAELQKRITPDQMREFWRNYMESIQ